MCLVEQGSDRVEPPITGCTSAHHPSCSTCRSFFVLVDEKNPDRNSPSCGAVAHTARTAPTADPRPVIWNRRGSRYAPASSTPSRLTLGGESRPRTSAMSSSLSPEVSSILPSSLLSSRVPLLSLFPPRVSRLTSAPFTFMVNRPDGLPSSSPLILYSGSPCSTEICSTANGQATYSYEYTHISVDLPADTFSAATATADDLRMNVDYDCSTTPAGKVSRVYGFDNAELVRRT